MQEQISTNYDRHLDCVIVRFPDYVTERQIRSWIPDFLNILEVNELKESDLLLDTNRHNFENIQCLMLLRETLTTEPAVQHAIRRAAFVQPPSVREPIVVSDAEAYFCEVKDAQAALRASSFLCVDLNGN
jgi:hypothetical protein